MSYWKTFATGKNITRFEILLRNFNERNWKIPKGQREILKSKEKQDHSQQNETKDNHRTYNTTLKTKAIATRTLQTVTKINTNIPMHIQSFDTTRKINSYVLLKNFIYSLQIIS